MTHFLEILIQALYTGAEWALIAVGFGFIVRTTNIYHLALGALFSVGGYSVYLLSVRNGLPIPLGVVAGAVLAGLVGSAIDRLIYQPVTGLYGQRRINHLAPFVTSLGILIVIQNGIQIWFGASPLYVTPPDFGVTEIAGTRVLTWNLFKAGLSFAACAAFAIWLSRTRTGASAVALGQSAEGASVVGVSEASVRFQIFLATGVLAGLGGGLAILSHPTLPQDGFPIVLYGALISLILPKAGVMVWWVASVGAAYVYAQSIATIGGGWQDTILQSLLMGAIVVSRILIPWMQRRAQLRASIAVVGAANAEPRQARS